MVICLCLLVDAADLRALRKQMHPGLVLMRADPADRENLHKETADLSTSLRPGIPVNRNSSSSIKGSFFPQGAGWVDARNPQGGQNGREDGNRCEDDHDGEDGRCVIDADPIEHAVHGAQRACT